MFNMKYTREVQISIGLSFSSAEIPTQNRITLLVVRDGIPITITMYHCMSTSFLAIVNTVSEQVAPLAVNVLHYC
jgi:hypothetical protein